MKKLTSYKNCIMGVLEVSFVFENKEDYKKIKRPLTVDETHKIASFLPKSEDEYFYRFPLGQLFPMDQLHPILENPTESLGVYSDIIESFEGPLKETHEKFKFDTIAIGTSTGDLKLKHNPKFEKYSAYSPYHMGFPVVFVCREDVTEDVLNKYYALIDLHEHSIRLRDLLVETYGLSENICVLPSASIFLAGMSSEETLQYKLEKLEEENEVQEEDFRDDDFQEKVSSNMMIQTIVDAIMFLPHKRIVTISGTKAKAPVRITLEDIDPADELVDALESVYKDGAGIIVREVLPFADENVKDEEYCSDGCQNYCNLYGLFLSERGLAYQTPEELKKSCNTCAETGLPLPEQKNVFYKDFKDILWLPEEDEE